MVKPQKCVPVDLIKVSTRPNGICQKHSLPLHLSFIPHMLIHPDLAAAVTLDHLQGFTVGYVAYSSKLGYIKGRRWSEMAVGF